MQGKKTFSPKIFTQFNLVDRIPENNFYRRLKDCLDLRFLYQLTRSYYGECGQKSIDPMVFFKLMLVGYLENIISDRQLMQHCGLRLDILYFLDYDIDELLPWHSTLSRTRQKLPTDVFEQSFEKILKICIEKGMVRGHTQAIDSAYVKANASLDSLEVKQPQEEVSVYLHKVIEQDNEEKENNNSQIQDSDPRTLRDIKRRQEHWRETQQSHPGARAKNSKYLSNKTHYSPTDPDARISVKPGKPRQLNYLANLSVDTEHHVITHIQSDYADKKDSQTLKAMVSKTQSRLKHHDLEMKRILTDAGYSSGENYRYLEQLGIEGYIPVHGQYEREKPGFKYNAEHDRWQCSEGKYVTFRKITTDFKGHKKKVYFTRRSDCKGCPIKIHCIGKQHEKRITVTIYKEEYDRMIERVSSSYGKSMKRLRQSTVEPVIGTLINFLGLRKINTRGIEQANKVMLMAAMAYNLKKYLNFTGKLAQSQAKAMEISLFDFFDWILTNLNSQKQLKFVKISY